MVKFFIVFFAFIMANSWFPDDLNNKIGSDHKMISTKPVYAKIGNDFVRSVNADGFENPEGMYFVVEEWNLKIENSIKHLKEYNSIYNNATEVFAKSIKVNKREGYIQELSLKDYKHVVFQILISDSEQTYLIETGCPESKKDELIKIIKTIAVEE